MMSLPRTTRVWLPVAILALIGIPGASATLDGVTLPIPSLSGTRGDNGWWRSNVTVQWQVDVSNGFIGSTGCGPDVVIGDIKGATRLCTATYKDATGTHAVATKTVPINIDATPPVVDGARPGRRPDRYGWYSHRIRVTFSGTDALSRIASCTRPVYRGPTSASATLTGRCKDMAGNVAAGTYGLKYAEPFLTPRSGTRVTRPPILDWPTVAKAALYNVQLWHEGKVLSKWPTQSKLRLRHGWYFDGERVRLKPGRYDWYVWPRINGRYHHLVGHGIFYKRRG
jgi:hypothetical protein